MTLPQRRTAWTFQLFEPGDFQLMVDVRNMGRSDLFIRRTVLTRNAAGVIVDRKRKKIAEIVLTDSGPATINVPNTDTDLDNDIFYSAHCVAFRGVGPSAAWSWSLGVVQLNARCPLSWGPIRVGNQCMSERGITDPCEGGHPYEGGALYDDATIIFDVLPPPVRRLGQ